MRLDALLAMKSTDNFSESMALTTGAKGKHFQAKAWEEILQVLEEQAPDVRDIVQRS